MNIAVLAYDFPHKKTQDFLFQLYLERIEVSCVIAAPWVKLNLPQRAIRTTPKHLLYNHPKDICDRMNIPYYVCAHNSQECINILQLYKVDLALIAGARILKEPIINAVKMGIVNIHPGIIPECRGLDTVEWAIVNDLDIGVTAHFIEAQIDAGKIILKESCKLYKDDTIFDIWLRVNEMQVKLLPEVMKRIFEKPKGPWEKVKDYSSYYGILPPEKEAQLQIKLMQRLMRDGQ